MELLGLIFIWPFIIFVLGLGLVSLSDIFGNYELYPMGSFWFLALLVCSIFFLNKFLKKETTMVVSQYEKMEVWRRVFITISIALLLPIFTRYLVDTFNHTLGAVIIALVLGFGMVGGGMFIKNNKVLSYSNIIGGVITLIYAYIQFWGLGSLARIIAAGIGLIIAVVVSIIKLKDKLS